MIRILFFTFLYLAAALVSPPASFAEKRSYQDHYRGMYLETVPPDIGASYDVDILGALEGLNNLHKAIDLIYEKSPVLAKIITGMQDKGEIYIFYNPNYPHKTQDISGIRVAFFLPFYFDEKEPGKEKMPLPVVISRHGIKWPTPELAAALVHELVGHGKRYLQGQIATMREREQECEAWLYQEMAHQQYGMDKDTEKMIRFRQQLGGVGFRDGYCSDFLRYIRKEHPGDIAYWEKLNPDVPALLNLLEEYIQDLDDQGITKESLAAREEYLEQALARILEKGPPLKQYSAGIQLLGGAGLKQDRKRAVTFFLKAASQGHAPAQYMLARMCVTGREMKKDLNMAMTWIKLASQQGYRPARKALPAIYELAAENGNTQAMIELAKLYEKGKMVDQDPGKAASYYQMAAAKGDPYAQYIVAGLYKSGKGVDLNFKESVSWYQKAVDQGHLSSMAALGKLYEQGKGCDKSNRKASSLYGEAARKGSTSGQYYLAKMYLAGKGLEEDHGKAYYWLTIAEQKATAQFKEIIRKSQEQVAATLSPEEITGIRKNAEQWKAGE